MADCSPDALMAAAKCLRCVPAGELAGVKTWELCQWANKPTTLCPNPVTDAAALVYLNAYLAQVALNGGAAPIQANQDAIHVFLCTCIEAGIDTRVLSMCCFTPDNFIAATTPVINPSGSVLWNAYNLADVPVAVPTEYFALSAQGLYNHGTVGTGYLRTGVNFAATPNSNGIVVQIPKFQTEINGFTTGVVQAPFNYSSLIHHFADVRYYRSQGDITEAFPAFVGDQAACFLGGTRRAANDWSFYQGLANAFRVIGDRNTTTGTGMSTKELYLYCQNNVVSAAPTDAIDGFVSFAGYFQGLTQAQMQTLYTAVNVMRVSMGGGNV